MKELNVGSVGTYIHDYGRWSHVCDIPFEAAITWLQAVPELTSVDLKCGKPLSEVTNIRTDWLNKLFVMVDESTALYNYDGTIQIYHYICY